MGKSRDQRRKSATRRLHRQAGDNFDYNKSERFLTAVKVIVALGVLYFCGKWVYDHREYLVTEQKPVAQAPPPSPEEARRQYDTLDDLYGEIVDYDHGILVRDRTMNKYKVDWGEDRERWTSKQLEQYKDAASQKAMFVKERAKLVEDYNKNSAQVHDSVLTAGGDPLPRRIEK